MKPNNREQRPDQKKAWKQSVRSLMYKVTDRIIPFKANQEDEQSETNPQKVQKILLAVLLGLSVLILSARISSYVQDQTDLADTRADYQYYQNRILEEEEKAEALTRTFEDLSARRTEVLEDLFQRLSDQNLASEEERTQLILSSHLAGMTEVTGEGVRISIQDVEGIDYTAADRASIIHDADVRGTVNLLKASPSSKAIDINGERIIATSRLICTGPNILVNRNYMNMPFVISAVGDSDELSQAFFESDLYRDFQARGLRISVESSSTLTIPAFYDQELLDRSLTYMKVVE